MSDRPDSPDDGGSTALPLRPAVYFLRALRSGLARGVSPLEAIAGAGAALPREVRAALETALGRLEGVHVAIVGDVLHSRVARSLVQALVLVGSSVTLVGPPALLPPAIEKLGCDVSTDLDAIGAADVVYVLRMQRERMEAGGNYVPSMREYAARWGLTQARLRPAQKVMHPGPINRGIEIDAAVADGAAALITTQVRTGLVVRMAVLYDLLTTGAPVQAATALEVA